MQEVAIQLRFNRACLGALKRTKTRNGHERVVYCMLRDPAGRVMFLPTWWAAVVRYAADVTNSCQGLVSKIDWDPIIVGDTGRDWRRVVVPVRADHAGRERYCMHEAFRPGDVVEVNAVIPDGMTATDLHGLLSVAGAYKGISPFRHDAECYGTFEVLSVRPRIRKQRGDSSEEIA